MVTAYLDYIDPNLASQIRGNVLNGVTSPTLVETFNAVRRVAPQSLFPSTTHVIALDASALATTTPIFNRGNGSDTRARGRGGWGNSSSRGRFPPCEHCGKTNHSSPRCYQKFGYPADRQPTPGGFLANSTGSALSSAPHLAPPIVTSPMGAPPAQVTGISMSREGYDRWLRSKEPAKSSHTSHHTSSSTASTAFLASTPKSETWVIDSGHYCRRGSSLLSLIHSLSHLETVTITDGRSCSVTGKGIAQPTSSIPLSNVLYVPNLDVNLLSISALTKALYCSVKFFPYHCEFQDLQTGAQIGLGRETGRGLYELVPDSPSVGLSCLLSVKTSSILWHYRLGHPNLSKLKEALPGTSLSDYKCESCELGKHFRATYHRRDSIPCEHPFDLVHCDIWGPARSTSLSGFRY